MFDGKMTSILLGDGGAFCHYCFSTKAEANDVDIVEDGFTIDKELSNMEGIWEDLEAGSMKYDDPNRAGQTNAPLVERGILFCGILHYLLRSLDHCLKILYHIVGNQLQWSERSGEVKDGVKQAKKRVIDHIKVSNCTSSFACDK